MKIFGTHVTCEKDLEGNYVGLYAEFFKDFEKLKEKEKRTGVKLITRERT